MVVKFHERLSLVAAQVYVSVFYRLVHLLHQTFVEVRMPIQRLLDPSYVCAVVGMRLNSQAPH